MEYGEPKPSIRTTKDIELQKYNITPQELERCKKDDSYLQEKIKGYYARGLYEDGEMHVITLWVALDVDEEEIIRRLRKYMPTKFIN